MDTKVDGHMEEWTDGWTFLHDTQIKQGQVGKNVRRVDHQTNALPTNQPSYSEGGLSRLGWLLGG